VLEKPVAGPSLYDAAKGRPFHIAVNLYTQFGMKNLVEVVLTL